MKVKLGIATLLLIIVGFTLQVMASSSTYYKWAEPCWNPRKMWIECELGGTQSCIPSTFQCYLWP